jgi:predicted ABC-type ATPase
MACEPTFIIFAGANGVGKDTMTKRYLKAPNLLFERILEK